MHNDHLDALEDSAQRAEGNRQKEKHHLLYRWDSPSHRNFFLNRHQETKQPMESPRQYH